MSNSEPSFAASAASASVSADAATADATTSTDAVTQLRAASFEFAHLLRPAEGGVIRAEAQRLGTGLENTITRLDEFSALLESIHSGHAGAQSLLAELTVQTGVAERVFAQIDRLQVYMDALEASVRECEERMGSAEAKLANDRDELEERLARERSTSSFFSSISSAFSSLKKLARLYEPTEWRPLHIPDFSRSMVVVVDTAPALPVPPASVESADSK